jgi:hypothetical protein
LSFSSFSICVSSTTSTLVVLSIIPRLVRGFQAPSVSGLSNARAHADQASKSAQSLSSLYDLPHYHTYTRNTHSLANLENMHTPFSNPILTPHPHLKRSNNAMHYPTARSMMDEIDLQLCLDIDPIVSPPPHIGCRLLSTKPSSVMESLFTK